MSKRGVLLLSNVRLLLRNYNVRQLERCCQAKTKTAIATLHFWPGQELQLNRTFASSTNSDDTDATWRKKNDKHKDQPTTEKKSSSRQVSKAKIKDYEADDISAKSAMHRKEALALANRMLTFKVKQEESKNLIRIKEKFQKNRKRINKIKERLALIDKKEKRLEKSFKKSKTRKAKKNFKNPIKLLKRPQKKSKSFTWKFFATKKERAEMQKNREKQKRNLLMLKQAKKAKPSKKR